MVKIDVEAVGKMLDELLAPVERSPHEDLEPDYEVGAGNSTGVLNRVSAGHGTTSVGMPATAGGEPRSRWRSRRRHPLSQLQPPHHNTSRRYSTFHPRATCCRIRLRLTPDAHRKAPDLSGGPGPTLFSYWELLAVLAKPARKSSTYRRAQSKSCHPAPGWWLGTG